MSSEPPAEPIHLVWPQSVWSIVALAFGVAGGIAGGLVASSLVGAALLAFAQGLPVAAGLLSALTLAVAVCAGSAGLAGGAAMVPWKVHVDPSGVTAGRMGLARRPVESIRAVRVQGEWGVPIRITLDDGTPVWVERSAEGHDRREHDPERLRARARDIAAVLGVPLVDELADAASFTARRLESLAARQAGLRAAHERNRAAHPTLHAVEPVEPPSIWKADRLQVDIGTPRRSIVVSPSRVTGAFTSCPTWTIDEVHVHFETTFGTTWASIHIERDGRTSLLSRASVSSPAQVGHLHWLADQIRRAAHQARASRAERLGTVPDALRVLRSDARAPERPQG